MGNLCRIVEERNFLGINYFFDCGINYPSNKISRFYDQVALMSFNPPLRFTNTVNEKLYRKIVVNSNNWILIRIGIIYNTDF